MHSKSTKHLVILDELSLLRVFWLIAGGKDVYLLDTKSLLFFMKIPLNLLTRWLVASRQVQDLKAIAPELKHIDTIRAVEEADTSYQESEPILLSQLRLPEMGEENPDYDFAARKTAINQANYHLGTVRFIKAVLALAPDTSFSVVGGNPILESLFPTIIPENRNTKFVHSTRGWKLFNIFLSGVLILYVLAKAIGKFRLRPKARQSVFFAVDVSGDHQRMMPEINDILDDPKADVLFVFRNKSAVKYFGESLSGYQCCPFGDGQLSTLETLRVIGKGISDSILIYRRFGHAHPSLFFDIAKLNSVRIANQALFNKYDIKYFWARDQYNPEHIIRSQELRKRGGTSVGFITGFNVFPKLMTYSFIDYDITHVLAIGPILKYNRDTW